MSLVIAVALLKSRASKTTTAVALAEAAALSVPAVLIDTDPIGSAVRWAELARASGYPLRAEVVKPVSIDLAADVRAAGLGAAVVVIDTPPGGSLPVTARAIKAAGRVVMPTPPRAADLDRVAATAQMTAELRKPAVAVLTQVRGGIEDASAAAVTLRSWGIPVYATQLPLTATVQRAYGQPVTSGPLLRFGIDLLTEIATRHDDRQPRRR